MEFRNFRETVLPSKFKICWYNTCPKKDPELAKTYKPVSILPTVSKVFERIIQKQLLTHIERFLSPYLCRYRKGYSTQQVLISLIEKWRKYNDNILGQY